MSRKLIRLYLIVLSLCVLTDVTMAATGAAPFQLTVTGGFTPIALLPLQLAGCLLSGGSTP